MNDLRSLVDGLALELGRPVGLDDRQLRSLAYSSNVEDLDEVRLSSILQREAPKAVTEYLASLHIDVSQDHDRQADARRHPEARIGRDPDTVLGYVWLLDRRPDRRCHPRADGVGR